MLPAIWLLLVIVSLAPFFDGGDSSLFDVILAITPLILVALVLLNKSISKASKISRFHVWLLLWVLLRLSVSLLSLSQSVSIVEGAYRFFSLTSIWLVILFAVPTLYFPNTLSMFARILTLVAWLLSVISIIFFFLPAPTVNANINFIYATYGHNRLAEYLVLVLPIIYIYLKQANFSKTIKLALLLPIILAFALTLSRAAWVISFIGPILYLGLQNKIRQKLENRRIVLGGLIMALSILYFISVLPQIELSRLPDGRFKTLISKPLNLTARLDYFSQSWRRWQTRPWLGFGPGTFQYFKVDGYTERQSTTYAHNLFLQELNETGILGLLATLVYLGVMFFLAFKSIRASPDPLRTAAFTGVSLSFLHAQLDFGWQIPAITLTANIVLVAVIVSGQKPVMSRVQYRHLFALALLPVFILLLLPFVSRGNFREKITQAEMRNDMQKASYLLARWERIDQENSEMFYWRASRLVQQDKFGNAAKEYLRGSNAIFRNWTPDLFLASELVKNYLDLNTQILAADIFQILDLIDRTEYPYGFLRLEPKIFTLFRQAVDKLANDPAFESLSSEAKAKIYFWKYLFALESGEGRFDRYQSLIDRVVDYSSQEKYQQLKSTNLVLANSNEVEVIKNSINQFTQGNEQTWVDKFLLAYLYTSLADLYQSSGFEGLELESRSKAIKSQPYLASSYVNLALRLYELDSTNTQFKEILNICETMARANCIDWFDSLITSQGYKPNL